MKKEDFSVKVRKAAKKASDNGRCWWVEMHILNSYLWRGPIKDLNRERKVELLSIFLEDFKNIEEFVDYFEVFREKLSKKNLNYLIKSVINS